LYWLSHWSGCSRCSRLVVCYFCRSKERQGGRKEARQIIRRHVTIPKTVPTLSMVQNHCKLFSDNHNAIRIAKNSTFHSRTKHIDNGHQVVPLHSLTLGGWIVHFGKDSHETILQICRPKWLPLRSWSFVQLQLVFKVEDRWQSCCIARYVMEMCGV
jgi:hypothetical protein